MSKHACQIDAAQERDQEILEDSLNAVRSLVPEEKDALTDDDLTCDICCEPNSIPPARAYRGYTTCLSCQSQLEKHNKQYNRRLSRTYYDEE